MLKDIHGRLRPLGIADIIDETVELYRSNFVLLVGVSAVLNVPLVVLIGLLGGSTGVGGLGGSLVSVVAAFVVGSAVTGALTFAVSERYVDRPVSVGEAYRRVLRQSVFFPFLGAIALKSLVVFAPMGAAAAVGFGAAGAAAINGSWSAFALAAAGMVGAMGLALAWAAYFGVRLLLVEPAVILERVGAVGAMSRSWKLMAGSWWKGFGLFLIVTMVTGFVAAALTGPTTFTIMSKNFAKEPVSRALIALDTIISAIVQTLVAPWPSIAWILLYYDVRIRKEGFDLELLARELEEKSRAFRAEGALSLPQERPSENANRDEQPGA
ncbi:MAG: glycerophosphoryl diester phosphodiesterase membrane domain-containing protein [Armatimonadota bacterium]